MLGPSQLNQNTVHHIVEPFENIRVQHPVNPEPLRLKPRRPAGVASEFLCCRMRSAIDFNNQLTFAAHEIGDIRTNRFLTPELETLCPASA